MNLYKSTFFFLFPLFIYSQIEQYRPEIPSPTTRQNNYFGGTLDVDSNFNNIIIGSPGTDNNSRGRFNVFKFENGIWSQTLGRIGTVNSEDLGSDVAINDNGDRIFVGTKDYLAGCDACVKVSNAGRIEIFDWDTDSNTWVSSKVFTGSGTSKNLGTNIEISSDGNYLVLSEKNGPFIVMRYDGTDWVQMGSSINNSDTLFFPNVSISDDGSTLAISQVNYDFNRGRTFIYQFENDWNLIDTLVGENQGDQFGAPVLSGDGNKLAVSATGFNSFKGKVYTYNYTPGGTTTWTLTGLPNTFIASNNNSYIQAHNFNKDGTRLVIGHNFGTTNNTGKILIYDYTPSATDSWTLISTGTTTWTNVSNEFIGENNYGIGANKSVQISSSGNQIAYGAPNFNGNIGKVILLSLTSTPTLTITSSDYGVNITDTVEIYFSSNKDTNDFTIEDISVTSGSISNFTSTSSKVYSVNYTPPSNSSGTVTFSVADNAFTDSSGSGNISSTLNILFDTISPTLSSFTDNHIDSIV